MDGQTGTDYSCFSRILACFGLAIIYVASLYVWNSSQEWNHPENIKKKFLSVGVMTMISPFVPYYFLPRELLEKYSLWELLGLRLTGIVQAVLIPLFLTMILFLGPLVLLIINYFKDKDEDNYKGCYSPNCKSKHHHDPDSSNLVHLKNLIVAPLSEEFTFRACMLPLFLQCLSPTKSIIFAPFLFSIAHLHHVIQLKKNLPLKHAIIVSSIQLFYTTLFGNYSAFLYYRTGHLISPFIVHSFCNYMGFPDFNEIFSSTNPQRYFLIPTFVTGLILWIILVVPSTNPDIYLNNLIWTK